MQRSQVNQFVESGRPELPWMFVGSSPVEVVKFAIMVSIDSPTSQ